MSFLDNSKINQILNTSELKNRAETNVLHLKNHIIDSEKQYLINKKRFEQLREQTNKINKFFISLKYKEKRDEKLDQKNKIKFKDSAKEKEKTKISSVLKENLLLLSKKKEIDSFYVNKNKKEVLKENKKIR